MPALYHASCYYKKRVRQSLSSQSCANEELRVSPHAVASSHSLRAWFFHSFPPATSGRPHPPLNTPHAAPVMTDFEQYYQDQGCGVVFT